MLPAYMNMDFARFCSMKGWINLTPEDKQEWTKIARRTLNYMLHHTDECDSRDSAVQAGMRGLQYFLTEPDDVRRLNELSKQLGFETQEQ
jgi:hypothetical protein